MVADVEDDTPMEFPDDPTDSQKRTGGAMTPKKASRRRAKLFLLIGVVGVAFVVALGIMLYAARSPSLQTKKATLPLPGSRTEAQYPCDAGAPPDTWRCVVVAPDGNDANSGTVDAPVATLERARMVVRGLGTRWEGDVAILLREGGYGLQKTLTLEPADSGKNGHQLLIQPYGGEKVTLSGGTLVKDWAPLEGGGGIFYTTDVPAGVEFRHLVVNGRRAQRAQHPNAPAFQTIAAWDPSVRQYGQPCPDNPGRRLGVKDGDAWFVDSLPPAQLSRVEVFAERVAGAAILRIDSAGQANEGGSGIRYLVPKDPERSRLFSKGGCEWQVDGLSYRFENSMAFLDTPGEFFLETTGTPTLYYIPRPGEDLTTAQVVAPRLETLVKFQGTDANRVQNITLRGLHFTATTWLLPNTEGFVSLYPGNDYREAGKWDTHLHPATVHLEGTERVTLERNVLHALGGMGIDLHDYTKNTVVDGNAVLEVAGIGITVDGEGYVSRWPEDGTSDLWAPSAGQPRSSGDRITNNRIQQFGLDYRSAVGIAAAYPWEMALEHNEISDGFSHGIVVGWYGKWTRCHPLEAFGPPSHPCQTAAGKNRIIGNRVFAVAGINNDVGGIYTLGHQSPTDTFEDGLEIRGNHVFGMKRVAPAVPSTLYIGIHSLYLDGDTSFTRVLDNIFEKPAGVGDSIFLNPDDKSSVPPHDIQWSESGAKKPPGDNATNPNLKPQVRDTAGLLPAYRDVPKVGETH